MTGVDLAKQLRFEAADSPHEAKDAAAAVARASQRLKRKQGLDRAVAH